MLTWPKMHWGYWKVRFLLSWRRIPFQGCRKPSGFGARANPNPVVAGPRIGQAWHDQHLRKLSNPSKSSTNISSWWSFAKNKCSKERFNSPAFFEWCLLGHTELYRAGELSFRRTQWYLGVIESNSGQKSVRLTGNKESALYISRIQLRTLASPKDETSMFIFITEY